VANIRQSRPWLRFSAGGFHLRGVGFFFGVSVGGLGGQTYNLHWYLLVSVGVSWYPWYQVRPRIFFGVSVGGLGEGAAERGDHGCEVLVQRLALAQPPVTQLQAQGPSRTCNESKEEEEAAACDQIVCFRSLICAGARQPQESCGVWYKSRRLKKTICPPSEGW